MEVVRLPRAHRHARLPAAVLVVLVAVLSGGCVSPTGPGYQYEIKAAVALETAQSAAGAAVLATRQIEQGRSTQDLFAVLARQAEDTASHATSTFDTRQPPGPRGDEVRAKVLPVLDEIASTLTDLRIAAFRGDIPAARKAADELPRLASEAEHLAEVLRR